jgi:hypothetical protein
MAKLIEDSQYRISREFSMNISVYVLVILQVALIILWGTCSEISYVDKSGLVYSFFTSVEIVVLFGFGYLSTFLQRYGVGAVGFTMLIVVVGLQWGVFLEV